MLRYKSFFKRILNPKLIKLLKYFARFINYGSQSLQSPTPLQPKIKFSNNWLSKAPSRISKNESSLVYLVSPTQRSGTNFLSYMLKSHPEIYLPEKPDFPNEHFILSYAHHLKNYVNDTIKIWGKWFTEHNDKDFILNTEANNLMSSLGFGLMNYFNSLNNNSKYILLRTPDALNINLYFNLFPDAKIIILLRDGRDTVESYISSWGGAKIFRYMTKRWSQRMQQINDFIENNNHSKQILIIKYEDIVQNKDLLLNKTFNFLDLDQSKYDWNQLNEIPILGSSSFKDKENNVHWNPIIKEDYKPINKWIKWSKTKKSYFKKHAGKWLIKYDYESNNNW